MQNKTLSLIVLEAGTSLSRYQHVQRLVRNSSYWIVTSMCSHVSQGVRDMRSSLFCKGTNL